MRLPLRLLLAAALAVVRALAADAWVRPVNDGFGDSNNVGVEWLQAFNGRLYAAVGRDNTNVAGSNFVVP